MSPATGHETRDAEIITELEEKLAQKTREADRIFDVLTLKEDMLADSEASCAAMRDLLEDGQPDGMHGPRCTCLWHMAAKGALCSNAGKDFEARVWNEAVEECAEKAGRWAFFGFGQSEGNQIADVLRKLKREVPG